MSLALWIVFSVMDIFLTWTAIAMGGEELNPLFHIFGWKLALLFKVVLIVGMPIAWRLASRLHEESYRYGMMIAAGIMGAVVLWNALVLI